MRILISPKEQWWYIMLKKLVLIRLPSNLLVGLFSNVLHSLCTDLGFICTIKKTEASSECKSAGGDVPYLSNDLVVEILGRLPTKSLCKFKCVSKRWEGLIVRLLSDRQRVRPLAALLLSNLRQEGPTKFAYAPISTDQPCKLLETDLDERSLRVAHCCNGLLLCHTNPSPLDWCCRPKYFVCNPTTMESFALPPPRIYRAYAFSFLAFDPQNSPHYKVVRFLGNDSARPTDAVAFEIYSSLTGKWVKHAIQTNPRIYTSDHYCRPVLHRGVLYWLCFDGIVRFDIEKVSSRYCLCKWPYADGASPDPHPGHRLESLGASRGRLYAVSSMEYSWSVYYIWILEEGQYPIKWELTHVLNKKMFDNNPLTCDEMKLKGGFKMLAFHPDSELLYLGFDRKIVSYEPTTGRLEEVYRDFSGQYDIMSSRAFTISLLPWNL